MSDKKGLLSQDDDDAVAKYALLDAFHHEPSAPNLINKKKLCLRATRHSVFFKILFIGAACLLLFFVPLLEQKHSFTNSTNYLTHKEESVATKSAFLWSSTALEIALLLVLLLDIVLKGIALFPFYEKPMKKPMPKSGKPNIVKWYICHHRFFAPYRLIFYAYIICWVASFICIIGTISTKDTNWFITTRQLVRPLFLIVQVTMLKKALKAIFNVSLRQLFVLASYALLFIVIFVFMMIGFGIFPRNHPALSHHKHNTVNEEGNEYFNSSADAYWNLIVYLSTANNPDIATPAYEHHRLYYLYFCAFYFIGKVLILKVIAVFYAINFNSFIDESMERTWKHQKSSIHLAFDNMKKANGDTLVDADKLKNIVTNLNIIDDGDFKPKSDVLSYKKFENLIIEIFYKKPSKQRITMDSSTKQTKDKAKCMDTFQKGLSFLTNLLGFLVAVFQFFALTVLVIEDYNDTLTGSNSKMARTMTGFSIVLGFEIITRLVLLIMKCAIRYGGTFCCKQNSNDQNKKSLCKKIFNWFFCGHSLRLGLSGRKKFIKIPLLIFDWLLLIAVFSLGLVHFPCLIKDTCLNSTNLLTLTQITICCIALRMLRMLAKIPVFSFVFNNLIRILYLFIPFLLLGYLFYYEFAIIGMTIFRGVNLNDTEAAAECGSYQNLEYHPYNFKDFGSTLVLLWNLMIVNNWHVMVDAYVKQTSVYSRIYFVIWWLVSETIINGVIFGLLIEILTDAKGGLENVIKKSIKKFREQKSWKDKLSLLLGFYVFSGEKSRVLLKACDYSFSDIIKIVFCKIMPESNKPAIKTQKLKSRSRTMPCQQDLPSSNPSLQEVDMTPKPDQELKSKDDTEQGNTEQVKINSYKLLYHYESDDENEGCQSTQESEDEELPDNFQYLSYNIFNTLEYIKNQRATETKAKKRRRIK